MNGPDKRMLEREALRNMIQQWNVNRLDLFELSEPNEDLSFHGVMRFYFQDSGQKVATKCIRVASDATANDVIETLIEKFRPDMRMLSVASYALYELHSHEERKLAGDEKPLLVQLNWHIDDREGRFLLKNVDHKTSSVVSNVDANSNFKRKLSKREKKELKKKEKLSRMKSDVTKDENYPVAEKLYTELPETSFTRSISNPEAVMRRRRQQKLERKLQQFRSKDGGPDTGGTLKIYGESLCSDVPYKTLLLSINDCAASVVKEMMDKYGLGKLDSQTYCLFQVDAQDNSEYILDDDECPLAIVMTHPHRGSIMFHVRRRPADCHPRRRKKKSGSLRAGAGAGGPCAGLLLETQPDGSSLDNGRSVRLATDVVEVGSATGVALQVYGPSIQPRHCVVAAIDGVVTLTPLHADAHTFINGQQIFHTTILQHGCLVKFGRTSTFRFVDPVQDSTLNRNLSQSHNFDSGSVYDRSPTSPVPDNISGMMSQSIHSQLEALQSSVDTCGINSTGGSDLQRAMSPISASNNTMTGSQENFPLSIYNGKNQRHSTDSMSGFNNNNNNSMKIDNESLILSNANSKADFLQDNYFASHYNDMANPQNSASHKDEQNSANKNYNADYKDNYETTFDLDGNVETKSVCSIKSGGSGNESRISRGQEAILPAVLEFPEHTQQLFLHSVITELDVDAPAFKLAPVYTLYLCARYRASTHYRPELTPTERAHKLTALLQHVATLIQNTVQERHSDAGAEAFWMANGSELLHFLKSDRHISAFSTQAQNILAHTVQTAFSNLVRCFHVELSSVLAQWLEEPGSEAAGALLLGALGAAMALLRRCRVNAALTIQLFSQLFHFINVWCFNKVVRTPHMWRSGWGALLRERLAPLSHWAERQGLELAADCHLATIHQCTHLLQAPKNNVEDMVSLSSVCFKLNSVQLSCLLGGFSDDRGIRLSPELVQAAVQHAQGLADELHRADGREITLEESSTLPLSLLIPEDGFSAEVVRGLPGGLADFLAPLQRAGLCRLAPQPHSQGHWTVYMNGYQGGGMITSPPQQPLVQVIKLHKNSNGMGLSIVAAKGAGQSKLGIYIKSVVPGGAAAADQRLQAGDQLLSVDGHSLVGISQERAAEYLVRTGPVVTLEVAKQGAVLHGLATLLRQPSPNRGYLSGNPIMDKKLYSSNSDNSLNNISYAAPLRHSVDSDDSVLSLHSMVDESISIMVPPSLRYPNIAKLYASGVKPKSEEGHLKEFDSTENICHREQCVDCPNHSYSSDCTECAESRDLGCQFLEMSLRTKSHFNTEDDNISNNIYGNLCIDDCDEIPYIDETDSEPLIFEHKTCYRDNECQTNDCGPNIRLLFSDSIASWHGPLEKKNYCDIDVTKNSVLSTERSGTNFLYKSSDQHNNVSIDIKSKTECDEKYLFKRESHNEDKSNICNRLQLNVDNVKNRCNFNENRPTTTDTRRSSKSLSVNKNVNQIIKTDINIESNSFNLPTDSFATFNKKSEFSSTSRMAISKSSEEQDLRGSPSAKGESPTSDHKSGIYPVDLKLGCGKVKALVGHFDQICLTYQTCLKRKCQSSPNICHNSPSKCDDTAGVLSQSLTNVAAGNSEDHFILDSKNTLSQHEHKLLLKQLEDWSTYGTKQVDCPDTPKSCVAIPPGDQQKSAILYTENIMKEHQIDNNNLLTKLNKNDQKSYDEERSLKKKFDTLKENTDLSKPRVIKMVPRKTLSVENVDKIKPSQDIITKNKKFPHSYIVRRKNTVNKPKVGNFDRKCNVLKSIQNISDGNHSEISDCSDMHRSCPDLMTAKSSVPHLTVRLQSERKNVRDRPPSPHARLWCIDTDLRHSAHKRYSSQHISPRRMSERDLPSTLEAEQSGQHTVKSSKSVPALHEVFNPGYSRTSSSNSIPAMAGLRGRINQSHQHTDPNNFYQNLSTYKHPGPQDSRALTLAKGASVDFQGPPQAKGASRPQSAYLTSPGPQPTQIHSGYPSMPNVNESYMSTVGGEVPINKSWKGGQPASPRTPHTPRHPTATLPAQINRSQYGVDDTNVSASLNHLVSPMKQQPPVAPKPQGMKRGASGELISGDIVEGPPLPPTATHPLYQTDEGGSYLASSSEPPAVGLYLHPGVAPPPAALSNPWHREEREKELEARRLAARVWRDKQIGALQSLEHRSPQQEQQLRALTLERDFQRRAQEAQTEEDDKMHEQSQDAFEESQENVSHQKQENIASPAQDNKFSPHTPLSPPVQPKSILKSNLRLDNLNSNTPQSPNKTHKNTTFVTKPTPQSLKFDNTSKYDSSGQKTDVSKYDHNINSKYDPKLAKYDSNSIKYPEQMHKLLGKYEQDFSHNNLNLQNLPKFELSTSNNNVASVNQLSQNISNMTMSSDNYNRGENIEAIQRYDIQSHEEDILTYNAPPPPERGSSFAVMSHQQALRSSVSGSSQLLESTTVSSAGQPAGTRDKRVSFHRNPQPDTSTANIFSQGDAHGREDPDKFISEAESMLQSPTSPTGAAAHTPGVIGAQEFYRDPRTRRLAEQQKAQQAGSSPIPEKLSFKEKMKMFALESGESNTPKDKVKISRAQRDIDAVH